MTTPKRNNFVTVKQRCEHCRKPYQPSRSTSRFCSDTCRVYSARKTKIKSHHLAKNAAAVEWYTPPEYIAAARAAMGGIDLDPASCEKAQQTVKAGRFYTAEDDGLSKPWKGKVWLNPPYTRGVIAAFANKAVTEIKRGRVESLCMLTNAQTDASWWQSLATHSAGICLTSKRIRFQNPENSLNDRSTIGQSVFYFGDDAERFQTHFQVFGVCVRCERKPNAKADR